MKGVLLTTNGASSELESLLSSSLKKVDSDGIGVGRFGGGRIPSDIQSASYRDDLKVRRDANRVEVRSSFCCGNRGRDGQNGSRDE